MEQDYLKYLKTEREISEFKIDQLKKSLLNGDPSKKRLLAIEEEFVSIPFENIASNLSDLLSAIKIFRESRTAFYDLYSQTQASNIDYSSLLDNAKGRVKQKIKDLEIDIAGSKIRPARNKSRLLNIMICILMYLEKTELEISKMNLKIKYSDLNSEILKKYSEDIFLFYNDIILESVNFNFLNNNSKELLSEIKPLQNISTDPKDNFFSILNTKTRGRGLFGFFIPAKHIGREILRPYYLKLYDEDGLNISKLFSYNPKSILLNDEYYKFLTLLNPEDIKDNLVLLERYEFLMKKIFHLKLSGKDNLKIDTKNSLILVPASRTEDEGIRVALLESSTILSNILTNSI
jgi:hypothetical protein